MSKAVFRADASISLGSGHIMRCLALAGELQARGLEILFLCRELPGHLGALISEKGFSVKMLPFDHSEQNWQSDAQDCISQLQQEGPVDWLIVDNYLLDAGWEKALRPLVNNIMVIDDLANRPHDCDLLLDQNMVFNMEERYRSLVNPGCRLLLGPEYSLLRREFYEARRYLRTRDGAVKRIMVFFGGSDSGDETQKAVRTIAALGLPGIEVDVVIGAAYPFRAELERQCEQYAGFRVHCQIDNMAEVIAGADLAIGAGGTALWERCFLGLPAIVQVIADNQWESCRAAGDAGAVRNLGWSGEVDDLLLADAVRQLIAEPQKLVDMGKAAEAIMQKAMVAEEHLLLSQIMHSLPLRLEDFALRPLETADLDLVRKWRNSPRIRSVMFSDHLISRAEHYAWWDRIKNDDTTRIMVFTHLGRPVGLSNINAINREGSICSWGFYLGQQDIPRGSGTVMGWLSLNYMFEVLGIGKVCGEVISFNKASISFFKRLGFTQEGCLSKHIFKNGRHEDVLQMALFREQWDIMSDSLKISLFEGGC